MKKERIFWGVFFIAAAILLIVGKLGMLGEVNVWTLIGTIVLSACLIKSIMYKNIGGILFTIAFFCILYDKMLGIENLTPWPVLGAALLGSIGAAFLYHPHGKYHHIHHKWYGHKSEEKIGDAQVKISSSFGEVIKYVNSEEFESADISCSFGSLKAFFDHASILKEEAVICVDVSFGGAELYIPKTWKIDNQVRASFGGVDEHGRAEPAGGPVVKLIGEVSFGSVQITYI